MASEFNTVFITNSVRTVVTDSLETLHFSGEHDPSPAHSEGSNYYTILVEGLHCRRETLLSSLMFRPDLSDRIKELTGDSSYPRNMNSPNLVRGLLTFPLPYRHYMVPSKMQQKFFCTPDTSVYHSL